MTSLLIYQPFSIFAFNAFPTICINIISITIIISFVYQKLSNKKKVSFGDISGKPAPVPAPAPVPVPQFNTVGFLPANPALVSVFPIKVIPGRYSSDGVKFIF